MLKTRYKDKEEIPEGFESLYTEKDGEWVVTGIEGLKTEEDTKKLQESLVKERAEHKATKEKLSKFGDHNPETLDDDLQELSELRIKVEKGDKPDEEKLAQLVEAKTKPIQKQLEKVTKERDEAIASRDSANQSLVQGHRRDAIFEAVSKKEGIRKDSVSAILRFAADELAFDEASSEFRTDAGLNTSEWLEEFCDKNSYVMEPSKSGGALGGNEGDRGGGNPFKTENISDQMLLKKSDPVRYEKLKKQHEAASK